MKRDDPEAMRAYRRKYNATEKAREARRRYAATPEGRAVQKRSKERWEANNPGYHADYSKRRTAERLERINAIKMASGCADCGYRGHPSALDFDHVDPTTKAANVSEWARFRSWSAIESEMAKCEVVCANCHRIRTHTNVPRGTVPSAHPTLFDGEAG